MPPDTHKEFRVFYGWYVVAAGTLCIFAGLGFGRFALGMLLPAMAPSLELSYAQMGYISTANFVGYLLAVLATGFLVRRLSARRLISLALMLVGGSMILIGTATGFIPVLCYYFFTGVGSALSNVPMMALVAAWFGKGMRGRAAGFIVIGSGFAIIVSGKMIPIINRVWEQGWRLSWFSLGGSVLVVALISYLVLRDNPAELGLTPLGENSPKSVDKDFSGSRTFVYTRTNILHLGAIYFCFGFSYVIYATFIVMTMVQEKGLTESAAGSLWSWVGFLSLFSGPVFGTVSDRFGRRIALMVVFGFQAVSYLLVALSLPVASLYVSILCYGLVAWSIPSIMTALVGDVAGPEKASAVFGLVTFIFAIGQIIGPGIAGYLADAAASFSSSFLLAAIVAIIGIILSSALRNFNS